MDTRAFDAFTRNLSLGLSRRGMLAPLIGSIATHVAGAARGADAACKKVGRKCQKNKDCCSGARCKKDKCKCKSGRQDCDGDGVCENLNTDRNNCGTCGVVCVSPNACCDGACSTICAI